MEKEVIMSQDPLKDLVPSESEVRNIIIQIMQTSPTQLPIVLLRIKLAQLMLKAIDKLRNDLDESIKHLENQINKK